MKNLGPAFLAAAAMLCALTIAIAREHLGKYEWAVPYLGGMIALCIILGVVSLVVTGRQQDKRRDLSTPPPPRNRHHEQRVTQEANPQQNVYFGQEFLRQFREPQPPKQSFKPEPVEPEPNLQPGSPEYVSVVLNATGTWTEAPIKAYDSRARKKGLIIPIHNEPKEQGQIVSAAIGIKALLIWRDEDREICRSAPAPWLEEEINSIQIGAETKKILVAVERNDEWIAVTNLNSLMAPHYDGELAMTYQKPPRGGTLEVKLVRERSGFDIKTLNEFKYAWQWNNGELPQIEIVGSGANPTQQRDDLEVKLLSVTEGTSTDVQGAALFLQVSVFAEAEMGFRNLAIHFKINGKKYKTEPLRDLTGWKLERPLKPAKPYQQIIGSNLSESDLWSTLRSQGMPIHVERTGFVGVYIPTFPNPIPRLLENMQSVRLVFSTTKGEYSFPFSTWGQDDVTIRPEG